MTFTGHLSEFSLPEIFQFLEQGHKTGSLTIRTLPDETDDEVQVHYIWLHQGRIVAAADRLDNKGLVSMIAQLGLVSDQLALKVSQSCPINKPMGLYFKSQGLLQPEQLKLLFRNQVEQVSCLFELKDGQFEFDSTTLPTAEMTGMSLSAIEATLISLRTLQDWTVLAEKLPDATQALSSVSAGKPQLRLDSLEWQVWEFANGSISLRKIAEQLGLPVEKVQHVAFQLIVANLVEEVPLIAAPTNRGATTCDADLPDSSSQTNVSQLFLQNLVGFLQNKV